MRYHTGLWAITIPEQDNGGQWNEPLCLRILKKPMILVSISPVFKVKTTEEDILWP